MKAERPELGAYEFDVGADNPGASPHLHKRHVDSFYVLEGELEFHLGDETVRAGPGTLVSIPPGTIHAFRPVGPARFLNVHAPECGFTGYLRALARGDDVDPADFDNWNVD